MLRVIAVYAVYAPWDPGPQPTPRQIWCMFAPLYRMRPLKLGVTASLAIATSHSISTKTSCLNAQLNPILLPYLQFFHN
jgi:hypothetical protein